MVGPVVDLAFSYSNDEVVIGIVDSFGNLFMYKVVEQTSGTASKRLMEIMRTGSDQESVHRLVWCPYVPEPDSETDVRTGHWMLLLTHGSTVHSGGLESGPGAGGARQQPAHPHRR